MATEGKEDIIQAAPQKGPERLVMRMYPVPLKV
jgi:hypothetical protein